MQENRPEDLAFKQETFARVEAAAPLEALLLSSTSGLMPSDMGATLREPGRVVVGHPSTRRTSCPSWRSWRARRHPRDGRAAAEFYRSLGKVPVVLRKEIGGFVANRLQSVLFRESVHLVLSGSLSSPTRWSRADVPQPISGRHALIGRGTAERAGGRQLPPTDQGSG